MVSQEDLPGKIRALKLARKCANDMIEYWEQWFINPLREVVGRLKAELDSFMDCGAEELVELTKDSIKRYSELIPDLEKHREQWREVRDKISAELAALGVEGENK